MSFVGLAKQFSVHLQCPFWTKSMFQKYANVAIRQSFWEFSANPSKLWNSKPAEQNH